MKKIVFKTLIVTLVISAILGIGIVILDLWNDITGKVLLTTSTIFAFCIPGLCCSTIYEKVNKKYFSVIGMITSLLCCVLMLLLIWEIVDNISWKLILSLILLTSSFGHLSLILLIDNKQEIVKCFRNITLIFSIIIDILLLLGIYGCDISWKLISILAILIALGTIVTPILNKINNNSNSLYKKHDNKYEKLEQLKKLLDSNAINQEEYNQEKNKILNN